MRIPIAVCLLMLGACAQAPQFTPYQVAKERYVNCINARGVENCGREKALLDVEVQNVQLQTEREAAISRSTPASAPMPMPQAPPPVMLPTNQRFGGTICNQIGTSIYCN